jgi:hypothetical protein
MLRRSLLGLLAAPAIPGPAGAQMVPRRDCNCDATSVDLLLVLAMDASGSISEGEFRLQREGCAEALTDPAVLGAIRAKPLRSIGIAMTEWGAPGAAATVVDWMLVDGPDKARLAAEAIMAAPRSPQSWNAIGDGIAHAAELIARAPFNGFEKVIDVAGDGPDMRSRIPAPRARDAAVAAGITINGLAILGGGVMRDETLQQRLRDEVLGGDGAFLMTADTRQDFARAIRAKLVREIAGRPAAMHTASSAGSPARK